MNVQLQTGDRISAVVDRPWIASQGMVNSALISMGFAELNWVDGPGEYETVTGVYRGAPTTYDLPSQVKSFNRLPVSSGASPATPMVAPDVAIKEAASQLEPQVVIAMGMLEVAFAMFLGSLFRRRKP